MALLFSTVKDANSARTSGDLARAAALAGAAREISTAVGLELRGAADDIDPESATLVARRDDARREKDWAGADAARDELVARGWIVEDTPGGTRLRRP
jgi:cysteinyl-tRNA synthetase